MSKPPLISVIITNYNYARYVSRAIDSVLSQTYENIELIIIDDGSTDDSDKVIKEYAAKYPHIIYVSQQNHGVVYTRNKGMEMARGEYLCCLDADDFFSPDYLEKQYKYMTKYIVDIVYPNWQLVGDYSHKTDFPEFNFIEYQKQHFHIKPESLIRASSIKHKNGKLKYAYIPETKDRANDWAYFISLAANGLKFKLAKDNYVNYHVKAGSMGTRLTKYEDLKIFCEYLTMLKKQYGEKIIDPIELPIDVIKRQDAEISEKNEALLSKDNIINEKNEALLDKDNIIREMEQSLSWKVTKPLRLLNYRLHKIRSLK